MERTNLNKIIENHKSQEELMTLQEASALISTKTMGNNSGSLKKGLWLGVSVLLISVLGLVLWNSTNKNNIPSLEANNTNSSKSKMEKSTLENRVKSIQSPIIEPLENSKKVASHIRTSYLPKGLLPLTATKDKVVANSPMPHNKSLIVEQPIRNEIFTKNMVANVQQDTGIKSRYIYLTKTELEKFNIYLYDDALLYSSGNSNSYYEILLLKNGNQRSATRKKSIEDPVSFVSQSNIKEKIEEKDRFKEEDHLAVYVPYAGNGFSYYIVWFKKNKENLGKLPQRYQTNDLPASPTLLEMRADSGEIQEMRAWRENWKKNYVTPTRNKTLYSNNQIIFADKVLLKKLKIKTGKEFVKYKKVGGIRKVMSYSMKLGNTDIVGLYPFSNSKMNNTPPSFITIQDLAKGYKDITEFASFNQEDRSSDQFFYANKNSMLAVKVAEIDGEEVVFWYENTKKLLSLLPPEDAKGYKEVLAVNESLKAPIAESNKEENKLIYDKMKEFIALKPLILNPLKLDAQDLKKLNIAVNDGTTSYTMKDPSGYSITYNFNSKYSTTDIQKQEDGRKEMATLVPKYISDKYGSGHRLRLNGDSFTSEDLERLIPILVETEEEYHLSSYINGYFHPDCIFWYEPTEEFLNILSPALREQLTFELSIIDKIEPVPNILGSKANEEQNKSCIYLDPCANIKIKLKDCLVYPNPTAGLVNIKTISSETLSGSLTIYNLAGQEMFAQEYSEVKQVTTIDISNLPCGIYLITVNTANGDKITKRVIKE